jgi:hypothetical protein
MPKSKGRRKKKFSGVQTVECSEVVMRKNYKGELRPVENPIAGKVKKIIHRPQ